jgi:mono/diheme cytochrome c family protein
MRFPIAKLLAAAALVVLVPAVSAFQPPAGSETAATAQAQDTAAVTDPLLEGADIERGKAVFERVGICISCHGWDGDGMGKNPRSEGAAAKLRETGLDTQGLLDVIRCGIPGTPMPFHFSAAYKDPEICFGMTLADFEAGTEPRKGKTFREKDLISLVAYLQAKVVGAGETTLEQCEEFFEPGSKSCDNLRD